MKRVRTTTIAAAANKRIPIFFAVAVAICFLVPVTTFSQAFRIMLISGRQQSQSLASPLQIAQTFVVTNTNDSGAGSLRQAILDANASPGHDAIVFQTTDGSSENSLASIQDQTLVANSNNVILVAGTVDIGAFEAPDTDSDSVVNVNDNCPGNPNSDQSDVDSDGIGDVCDDDNDNDTVPDSMDNCPLTPNTNQANNDGDAFGDVCDLDDDNDGVLDTSDNCSLTPNANQLDTDGDGTGNAYDTDDDNDGVADATDNCPLVFNPNQADFDQDGIGDTCDAQTGPPLNKDQCKNDGWLRFDFPRSFKNQGDCIQFVNTGK